MSMASDILRDAFNAVGADVKAFFSKFDANGKLLKTYLPTLTKADVGLSNVDNTADIDKVVASARKLQNSFTLTLGNVLQGYVTIDGSGSVTMNNGNLNTTKAFAALFGGSGYQADSSTPDTYSAGTRTKCVYNPPSGSYNEIAYGGYITTTGMGDGIKLQTLLPNPYAGNSIIPFSGVFIRQRTYQSGFSNSAANSKWVPISTSTYTYNTTTSEAPNVYVGADGVLKRSTSTPSSPLVLTGVIGGTTSPLTIISHGVDASRIKSVSARVDRKEGTSSKDFVWDGTIKPLTSSVSYSSLFVVNVTDTSVIITAHKDAVDVHGKTVTIFIERY